MIRKRIRYANETPRKSLLAEIEELEMEIDESPEEDEIEEDEIEQELRAMEDELLRYAEEDIDEEEEEDIDEDGGESVEEVEEFARYSEDEIDIENYEDEIDDEEEDITGETMSDQNFARKALEQEIKKLEAAIDNPEDDRGIWQDFSEVEELMGVDDLTDSGEDGDMLDIVDDATDVDESDMIYASRLQEASVRLDNVADELEKRGGNWKKFAFRIDQIADAVDSKRKILAKKIASRK